VSTLAAGLFLSRKGLDPISWPPDSADFVDSWITPSLFNAAGPNAVDEWTFCETLGKPEALRRLQKHWDSWVTLQDFQKVKNAGFNVVRIPIGYWAFMDIQRKYLEQTQAQR
jgi:aryl-phospho-beta-D-glucosidase BglC (GH1 family)